MPIDYDKTAAEYEASLVTKLRGHGAGSFLEHWVPDPDPVLGIFNMIEAAWTDGRDEFDLVVSRATLGRDALKKLEQIAAAVADLKLEEVSEGYSLTIRRVARVNGSKMSTRAAEAPRVAARTQRTVAAREVAWDVHPSLVAALDEETAELRNEGALAQAPGCVCVEAGSANGRVSLAVGERDGLIRQAKHVAIQPPVRRRLLDLMCRAVVGRTVQDTSDHAAIYAVHALLRRAGRRPSEGILLPANAGLEVTAALRMLREACRSYEAKSGKRDIANFFETAPGQAWNAASHEERLRRVVQANEKFCAAEGLPANTMKPVGVEKDIHGNEIRVIVQVSDKLSAEGVPLTLRRLERFLKSNLDPVLQVYLEPWKDRNVLRRL